MKRYDLITNYRCGSAIEEMERADDGDWVRYEDVEAEVLRLRALVKSAEWSGGDGHTHEVSKCCPWCGAWAEQPDGHYPDCEAFGADVVAAGCGNQPQSANKSAASDSK